MDYNRVNSLPFRPRRANESGSDWTVKQGYRVHPRTVRKYLASELQGLTDGRTQPTRADRRRRDMLVPTSRGTIPVVIQGSRQASQLGRYMSAVGRYLRTGNTEALDKFQGQSIAGHPLITDPEVLSSLAQAGALQLDEIYAMPESSS